MTNKPEPVVTQQCDHAAAKSFESDIGCSLFADDLQLLAEAFAAHRTAAVARREAEIVGMADAAERESKTYQQYANAVVRIVMNLRKQNGGGA